MSTWLMGEPPGCPPLSLRRSRQEIKRFLGNLGGDVLSDEFRLVARSDLMENYQTVKDKESAMTLPRIATRAEWQRARNELLAKEKDLTRRHDELSVDRRNLPGPESPESAQPGRLVRAECVERR